LNQKSHQHLITHFQLTSTHGLVVKADGMIKRSWVQTIYWMAVNDAIYYLNMHKNNKNKGGRIGHTKKFKKEQSLKYLNF
jgi:hypothetical protein